MKRAVLFAFLLGLARTAHAQPAEVDSKPTEEPATGTEAAHEEGEEDPSRHFNYTNFSYSNKDEWGGELGDGKMTALDAHGKPFVVHEEEKMSPPFLLLLVNFGLLLALLAWKGRPAARKLAEERHDQIKTALDEAAKLRTEAADRLASYEKRLAAADDEVAKLVAGIRADAEADKVRILAAAEAQAAQLKRDAESRIAAEIEAARAALTKEVTVAAASATEKLLRDKTTAGDQDTLVGNFIADVQHQAIRKDAR
jgi:F-type H+-transporting ATPase subunit b